MRNTRSSSKLDQVTEGLITLAAMRAAANSVRTADTPSPARVRAGFCVAPKIISLTDELTGSPTKRERVFA
jgi:hypothetical protein